MKGTLELNDLEMLEYMAFKKAFKNYTCIVRISDSSPYSFCVKDMYVINEKESIRLISEQNKILVKHIDELKESLRRANFEISDLQKTIELSKKKETKKTSWF